MSSQRTELVGSLLAVLLLAATTRAEGRGLDCVVTYVAADGVYVDAGSAQGVAAGLTGTLYRGAKELGRVEVVAASRSSARVRLVDRPAELPRAGDRVRLEIPDAATAEKPPADESTPDEGRDAARPGATNDDTFEPMLEKFARLAETSGPRNIFHGSARIRELLHRDAEHDLDYSTALFGTSGSLERIGGTPWALRWFGNLSYRSGSAFDDSDLKGERLDVYELSFARKLDGGGLLKLLRFLPTQLPAAGYLDGLQWEQPSGDTWRLGVLAGLKPDRLDLAPSTKEPTAAAYATWDSGRQSGTVGLLGSLFEGELDRTALLIDHSLLPTPGVTLLTSAEVDFDVGAGVARSGTRLTRFDFSGRAQVTAPLALRAGVHHYERLDNRAERDAIGSVDPALFDTGYWRYSVGGDWYVVPTFSLDGEVAVIRPSEQDSGLHWRAGATYLDAFGVRGASLGVSVYNLANGGSGYGGQLRGSLPLGNWYVLAYAGFRTIDETGGDTFDVTDVSARVEYRWSRHWTAFAAVTLLGGDGLDSTLLELGLDYRW